MVKCRKSIQYNYSYIGQMNEFKITWPFITSMFGTGYHDFMQGSYFY